VTAVLAVAEHLLTEVARVRDQLDAADSATAWRGVGRLSLSGPSRDGGRRSWLRRWWPLLLWAALLVPALVYYGIGSTPAATGVQRALAGRVPFLLVLVAPALVGLGLLVWQLALLVRALPVVLREPVAENAARIQLRIATALGSIVLAATTAWAWLHGTQPSATLVSGVHVLDALSALLLVAGVVLLVAAFVFFPPSIGLVATTAGVLVPTIAVSSAFATTASLGALGIVLSQAAGNARGTAGTDGGGGGESPVPDLLQQPPRPKPQVRDWKLRRIVDNLWKGGDNPNHVGDGTTMDAVRNELRTGRPTEGKFHTEKAQNELGALRRWIDRYGSTASRQDRLAAWQLRTELENLLGGS
jgi:hypothetical protein